MVVYPIEAARSEYEDWRYAVNEGDVEAGQFGVPIQPESANRQDKRGLFWKQALQGQAQRIAEVNFSTCHLDFIHRAITEKQLQEILGGHCSIPPFSSAVLN